MRGLLLKEWSSQTQLEREAANSVKHLYSKWYDELIFIFISLMHQLWFHLGATKVEHWETLVFRLAQHDSLTKITATWNKVKRKHLPMCLSGLHTRNRTAGGGYKALVSFSNENTMWKEVAWWQRRCRIRMKGVPNRRYWMLASQKNKPNPLIPPR